MKYYAKIVSLNNDDENEITILLGDTYLTCFIESSHSSLKIGDIKLIEIILYFINEDDIELTENSKKCFDINHLVGYSYEMKGYLLDNKFIVKNIVIQDDIFFSYAYYGDSFVNLKIDRLGIVILD